jgi:hypothetical protein
MTACQLDRVETRLKKYEHHLLPPFHTTSNEYHNPHLVMLICTLLEDIPHVNPKDDVLFVEHPLSIFLAT